MNKARYKNRLYIDLLLGLFILIIANSIYEISLMQSPRPFFTLLIVCTLGAFVLTKHEWSKDSVRYWGILVFIAGSFQFVKMFIAFIGPYNNEISAFELVYPAIDLIIGIIVFMYNDEMFTLETIEEEQQEKE
jgi:uncharacterized membrane protein YiaA